VREDVNQAKAAEKEKSEKGLLQMINNKKKIMGGGDLSTNVIRTVCHKYQCWKRCCCGAYRSGNNNGRVNPT
jgi:hypothetical protein